MLRNVNLFKKSGPVLMKWASTCAKVSDCVSLARYFLGISIKYQTLFCRTVY